MTSTSIHTNIFTNTHTVTETDYFSVTSTLVTTITAPALRIRATKRAFTDSVTATYPPSRISSACNCLTLSPGTTITRSVTATAPGVPKISTIPLIVETSITITETFTKDVSITSSFTATSKTTVAPQASPSVRVKLSVPSPGEVYDNTYMYLKVDIPQGGAIAYPGGTAATGPTYQLQPDGQLFMITFGSAWVPGPTGASYSWNQPVF
ncbi:hypothetical protein ABW20_dc0101139 [Dactylellina cionopaga]|nr:hypothetical protein ABW20_dc0101139 [Dactylellina cionopaga]